MPLSSGSSSCHRRTVSLTAVTLAPGVGTPKPPYSEEWTALMKNSPSSSPKDGFTPKKSSPGRRVSLSLGRVDLLLCSLTAIFCFFMGEFFCFALLLFATMAASAVLSFNVSSVPMSTVSDQASPQVGHFIAHGPLSASLSSSFWTHFWQKMCLHYQNVLEFGPDLLNNERGEGKGTETGKKKKKKTCTVYLLRGHGFLDAFSFTYPASCLAQNRLT